MSAHTNRSFDIVATVNHQGKETAVEMSVSPKYHITTARFLNGGVAMALRLEWPGFMTILNEKTGAVLSRADVRNAGYKPAAKELGTRLTKELGAKFTKGFYIRAL